MTSNARPRDDSYFPGLQRDAASANVHRAYERLADDAAELRDEATHWMHDQGRRLRHEAGRMTDRTVDYVRDEPYRTAFMALAAGALIYGLVRLLRHSAYE